MTHPLAGRGSPSARAPGRMRQLRLVGQLVDVVQEREQLRALGFAGAVERLGRGVQKLVGESARERIEHLLRRRPASEQTARTVELGDAKLVMMSLQRSDCRHYRPAFEPAQKTRRL